MAKFSKIYVEKDGVVTDIADLSKKDYEAVLDIFMSIRTVYIVLTDRAAREGKDVVKKNK